MTCDQRLDSRRDDVIASLAVREDPQFVVQVGRAIHADRHADLVLGEKLDDGGRQKGGVGGQAEVHALAVRRRLFVGISHHLLQQREVHERLATEESDTDGRPAVRRLQQEIHGGLRRLEVHELRFALRRGYLVFAELVAILARKVALVGQVHHQRLQGKIRRRILDRRGMGFARHDHAGFKHLLDQLFGGLILHAARYQSAGQFVMREIASR